MSVKESQTIPKCIMDLKNNMCDTYNFFQVDCRSRFLKLLH